MTSFDEVSVEPTTIIPPQTKRLLGWIGAVLLLLIIPVKAVRWTVYSPMISTVMGIAPSLLGPAGLLFLALSSSSPWITRLTLLRAALIAGAIAVGLEFAQLIPLPGVLSVVHYTFDWLDVIASLLSVIVACVVARLLVDRKL